MLCSNMRQLHINTFRQFCWQLSQAMWTVNIMFQRVVKLTGKWVSKCLGPTKKKHEGRTGAWGQFLLSFENYFGGSSASLKTIFCAWSKSKDEREKKKEREKERLGPLIYCSFYLFQAF